MQWFPIIFYVLCHWTSNGSSRLIWYLLINVPRSGHLSVCLLDVKVCHLLWDVDSLSWKSLGWQTAVSQILAVRVVYLVFFVYIKLTAASVDQHKNQRNSTECWTKNYDVQNVYFHLFIVALAIASSWALATFICCRIFTERCTLATLKLYG